KCVFALAIFEMQSSNRIPDEYSREVLLLRRSLIVGGVAFKRLHCFRDVALIDKRERKSVIGAERRCALYLLSQRGVEKLDRLFVVALQQFHVSQKRVDARRAAVEFDRFSECGPGFVELVEVRIHLAEQHTDHSIAGISLCEIQEDRQSFVGLLRASEKY